MAYADDSFFYGEMPSSGSFKCAQWRLETAEYFIYAYDVQSVEEHIEKYKRVAARKDFATIGEHAKRMLDFRYKIYYALVFDRQHNFLAASRMYLEIANAGINSNQCERFHFHLFPPETALKKALWCAIH